MYILKYFRRRILELPQNQAKLNLPDSYVDFALNYNPVDIVMLLTKNPYLIGIETKDKVIYVRFVEINCLTKYELTFKDRTYKESIVLIAGNNIPEGGIYLDLESGKIYNLEDEPFRVAKDGRELIAESFDELLRKLRLFELSNENIQYRNQIDLEVPKNKDDLKLPWES